MLLILQIEDLCHAYYIIKTFRKIYNEVMHPLLEVDLDVNDIQYDCSTTNLKKSMGRLRKNRWKEHGEYQPGTIEKGLSHLDAIYVSKMTTISWHAKKIVLHKLEDPVLPRI